MAAPARTLVFFIGLAAASVARADRRELYSLVGYEAGVSHFRVPAAGDGSATTYAGALDLTECYGLTNSVYLGARARLTATSNVHFADANVKLSDGSRSSGDVYSDHRAFGLGALALFRIDTGISLAPLLELEGGFTIHQYRNITHLPSALPFSVPLADASETVFHGSAALLVEYRIGDRWLAATGVGVQAEPGGLTPWSVFVPFRAGWIW